MGFPFKVKTTDRIATAGSCFAQHISRHLRKSGYHYLVTEEAHPILRDTVAQEFNYGTFTARYGNLYTARQLLQLFQRAYGQFEPAVTHWMRGADQFIDPFRPTIQPTGFATLEELEIDRQQHFAAVREAFETLDVFIFTLGLTETWHDRNDGAVYPLCPGVNGGTYDESKHGFLNLSLDQTIADLLEFLKRHVWVSTKLSKAVLRLAAEAVSSAKENVAYFPSYEIVTAPTSRGRYYADNLRDVTEAGVTHVMDVFFKRATETGRIDGTRRSNSDGQHTEDAFDSLERVVEAICDEEWLDEQLR